MKLTMLTIPRILATTEFCLAAVGCLDCCIAAPQQSAILQGRGKPTHEEVRIKHIVKAQENLAKCKARMDALQAGVEIYGPGHDNHLYAVKADDLPRLRYIISQLQVNQDFLPVRVSMRHSRCLFFLHLDFGEGVILSLRAELITTPAVTGISHQRSLYALPTPELRRELIGIIERTLPPRK